MIRKEGDLHMKTLSILVAVILVPLTFVVSAMAQDEVIGVYTEGQLSFDYEQWPWGSYSGTFSAEGAALDSLLWGNEVTQACGGGIESVSDTTVAWGYGAIYQDDDTVDLAVLFVRGSGELVPGNYAIDPTTFMAGFLYLDGISEIVIPEDPEDIYAWFDAIVAEHKFMSAEGAIQVTEVTANDFVGTFSGSAIDPVSLMIITVDNGLFSFSGPTLTSTPEEMPTLQVRNYPNPFNPSTRIEFILESAQQVSLEVYDTSGRLIDRPFCGALGSGRHVIDWKASGRDDRRLPAGTYLYRLVGEREQITGKMILLP